MASKKKVRHYLTVESGDKTARIELTQDELKGFLDAVDEAYDCGDGCLTAVKIQEGLAPILPDKEFTASVFVLVKAPTSAMAERKVRDSMKAAKDLEVDYIEDIYE